MKSVFDEWWDLQKEACIPESREMAEFWAKQGWQAVLGIIKNLDAHNRTFERPESVSDTVSG